MKKTTDATMITKGQTTLTPTQRKGLDGFRPYVEGIAQLAGVVAARLSTWGHYDVTLANGWIVRLACTEKHEGRFYGGVYVFTDHRMLLDAEIAINAARPALVNATLRAIITDTRNATSTGR